MVSVINSITTKQHAQRSDNNLFNSGTKTDSLTRSIITPVLANLHNTNAGSLSKAEEFIKTQTYSIQEMGKESIELQEMPNLMERKETLKQQLLESSSRICEFQKEIEHVKKEFREERALLKEVLNSNCRYRPDKTKQTLDNKNENKTHFLKELCRSEELCGDKSWTGNKENDILKLEIDKLNSELKDCTRELESAKHRQVVTFPSNSVVLKQKNWKGLA